MFGGDRSAEFAARMAGQAYTAGGIRTTVAATRAASDETLAARARSLVLEALTQGTTTIEIKSGYGLSVPHEARCLHLAGSLTRETTYLGAHIVPPEYADRPDDYVALAAGEMLDACAPYARWADVFCERGAFDADQARTILTAARDKGLGLRLHANQLGPGPGVQLAVELGAASADHCTYLSSDDVAALADSVSRGGPGTVATLLPGAEFSTRSVYPDARRLLDAGATVALATDCNPGTSFTSSMPFVIALAVREMRMTCEEAVLAATVGGATALRREDIGRLTVGARADLTVLAAPSYVHLAYRPGVPMMRDVIRGGEPTPSATVGTPIADHSR
jgi:imidazolonepropionase